MVVGLFKSTSDAEIALNNLAEADFDASKISVVTDDPSTANIISDNTGTYTGYSMKSLLAALQKKGLTQINNEQIVIVVETQNTDEAAAAKEILESQNATYVTILQK
jgi:predicted O-methyltransferase YrrM